MSSGFNSRTTRRDTRCGRNERGGGKLPYREGEGAVLTL